MNQIYRETLHKSGCRHAVANMPRAATRGRHPVNNCFDWITVPRIGYGAGLAPLTAHPCATTPAFAGMTNWNHSGLIQSFLTYVPMAATRRPPESGQDYLHY
jgi:hypothetical protein